MASPLNPKGYLSLYDLAYIHDTTEQEVFRVWTMVLDMEPKEQFGYEDLLKVIYSKESQISLLTPFLMKKLNPNAKVIV